MGRGECDGGPSRVSRCLPGALVVGAPAAVRRRYAVPRDSKTNAAALDRSEVRSHQGRPLHEFGAKDEFSAEAVRTRLRALGEAR